MFNLAQILQQFQAQPWNQRANQFNPMQFNPGGMLRFNYNQGNQVPWLQNMQPQQQPFQPMQGGMNRPTTMPVNQPMPMQPPQGGFMPYQGGMGPTTMPVGQPMQQPQQQFQPMNRFGPAMWRR